MPGRPEDSPWTDDTIARLRSLWDDGHATREIGRRLGISKNAVTGKIHRLDLRGRDSPIRRGGSAKPPKPKRTSLPKLGDLAAASAPMPVPVQAVPLQAARVPKPVIPAATITPRTGRTTSGPRPCSWPIGDPGHATFRFCDAPALPGKSYCDQHTRLAYVRPAEPQHGHRRLTRAAV